MHLDVKRQWNSIPTMLWRQVKRDVAIIETLTDFKALKTTVIFDFDALKTLLKAMELYKTCYRALVFNLLIGTEPFGLLCIAHGTCCLSKMFTLYYIFSGTRHRWNPWLALKEPIGCVEPRLKNTAVENLSREDSTLMSADTILEFMLNKLSNFNNDISTKLFQN